MFETREAVTYAGTRSADRGRVPASRFGRVVRNRVSRDEVARTAQALIAAYGAGAAALMRERLNALRKRGDFETAALWHAVAEAVERRLGISYSA